MAAYRSSSLTSPRPSASPRVSRAVSSASPRAAASFEPGMQDPRRDQRYGPVALWRRLRVDQAGKAQPLEGAERRGGVAVRQGALNLEGFRQPLNGGSALEQHAQAFDHFGGAFRQVGQGCVS